MEKGLFRLDKRVVLITGSGQGIGKAIALAFARSGADIAVTDIPPNQEGAKNVQATIQDMGRTAHVYMLDVRDSSSVHHVLDQVASDFGRLDILVNNAGVTRDGLAMRMSEEDWDTVLDVNLKGAFLCSKVALRYMTRQRWGRIISLSSVVGQRGNVGQANYAASKAGLIGMTKSIAKEVASRNITVNAIAPGFIGTQMVQSLSEEVKELARNRIATGRFGTPEDVAHVAVFLASEEASYVTGQVIGVDGMISI